MRVQVGNVFIRTVQCLLCTTCQHKYTVHTTNCAISALWFTIKHCKVIQ